MMKPREPYFELGWTAAVIAVAAAQILIVDIAEKQKALNEPHTQTEEAAKRAGASVTPTDPKLAPL